MPAATARAKPLPSQAAKSRSRFRGRAFTRVEIADDFDAARDAWAEIETKAHASPYQSLAFSRHWAATLGASQGVRAMIVVARDDAGAVVALLPLGRFRYGPLRVAAFLGDRHANYQMGLFDPDLEWPRRDIEALLAEAARQARPRIDVFMFINQPFTWDGFVNPLARLARQLSPSPAFKSLLPDNFEAWLGAHFSKASQKKLRKKAKRLEAIGPLTHRRLTAPDQIHRAIEAFRAQKQLRARALGQANEFETQTTIAFIDRLAGLIGEDLESPVMELHALFAGERIVATFGGFADAHRLSGMMLSFDSDPAVAISSPGELLVIEIARDSIERGLALFDLGVGESRYKSECCETAEPLFDSALAHSMLGRVGAAAFLVARHMKRAIKRSPRLYALANRVRRRFV